MTISRIVIEPGSIDPKPMREYFEDAREEAQKAARQIARHGEATKRAVLAGLGGAARESLKTVRDIAVTNFASVEALKWIRDILHERNEDFALASNQIRDVFDRALRSLLGSSVIQVLMGKIADQINNATRSMQGFEYDIDSALAHMVPALELSWTALKNFAQTPKIIMLGIGKFLTLGFRVVRKIAETIDSVAAAPQNIARAAISLYMKPSKDRVVTVMTNFLDETDQAIAVLEQRMADVKITWHAFNTFEVIDRARRRVAEIQAVRDAKFGRKPGVGTLSREDLKAQQVSEFGAAIRREMFAWLQKPLVRDLTRGIRKATSATNLEIADSLRAISSVVETVRDSYDDIIDPETSDLMSSVSAMTKGYAILADNAGAIVSSQSGAARAMANATLVIQAAVNFISASIETARSVAAYISGNIWSGTLHALSASAHYAAGVIATGRTAMSMTIDAGRTAARLPELRTTSPYRQARVIMVVDGPMMALGSDWIDANIMNPLRTAGREAPRRKPITKHPDADLSDVLDALDLKTVAKGISGGFATPIAGLIESAGWKPKKTIKRKVEKEVSRVTKKVGKALKSTVETLTNW